MELRKQLPSSHASTAPVHPPDRVTGPPELHHSKGRYRGARSDPRATLNRGRLSGSQGVTPFLKVTDHRLVIPSAGSADFPAHHRSDVSGTAAHVVLGSDHRGDREPFA